MRKGRLRTRQDQHVPALRFCFCIGANTGFVRGETAIGSLTERLFGADAVFRECRREVRRLPRQGAAAFLQEVSRFHLYGQQHKAHATGVPTHLPKSKGQFLSNV